MPLFVWSIYATSIIQVLATPVLGITLLLVGVEHAFGFGIFDPARGGDPVLFQHLFWFYSHPAVYIMILPAMARDLARWSAPSARKNHLRYKAIAFSSLGIAFVGFFTWGHHMFVGAVDARRRHLRRPVDVRRHLLRHQGVHLDRPRSTRARSSFTTPMLYFFGFLFLFVFGGMTGVAVATRRSTSTGTTPTSSSRTSTSSWWAAR